MHPALLKSYDISSELFQSNLHWGVRTKRDARDEAKQGTNDERRELSPAYINHLYDLVDENKPLDLFQKIEIDKEINKSFFAIAMTVRQGGQYQYQKIKTVYQLGFTEVMMMAQNYRGLSRQCTKALGEHLEKFHDNKPFQMFEENPLVNIADDGRLAAQMYLRGGADPETLVTPPVDKEIFSRIQTTLKLVL